MYAMLMSTGLISWSGSQELKRLWRVSDCEELWSRQIVETLIFEVAIMHKRD